MSNIVVVKKLADYAPGQNPSTRPGQQRFAIVSEQWLSNGTKHYVPTVQRRYGGGTSYETAGDRQAGDPLYMSEKAAAEVARKFK